LHCVLPVNVVFAVSGSGKGYLVESLSIVEDLGRSCRYISNIDMFHSWIASNNLAPNTVTELNDERIVPGTRIMVMDGEHIFQIGTYVEDNTGSTSHSRYYFNKKGSLPQTMKDRLIKIDNSVYALSFDTLVQILDIPGDG
jgi:hypothetical protein